MVITRIRFSGRKSRSANNSVNCSDLGLHNPGLPSHCISDLARSTKWIPKAIPKLLSFFARKVRKSVLLKEYEPYEGLNIHYVL